MICQCNPRHVDIFYVDVWVASSIRIVAIYMLHMNEETTNNNNRLWKAKFICVLSEMLLKTQYLPRYCVCAHRWCNGKIIFVVSEYTFSQTRTRFASSLSFIHPCTCVYNNNTHNFTFYFHHCCCSRVPRSRSGRFSLLTHSFSEASCNVIEEHNGEIVCF